MVITLGSTDVGDEQPPYIIAEACNNFNANMLTAKSMVLAAKKAGCDAIKFQMRLQKDRISVDQHIELQEFCNNHDITYLCTAFDEVGLTILSEMKVPAIKIGSAECNKEWFLAKAAETKIPLIVSTGGTSSDEVRMIARYADILMHTISAYPTPYELANLDLISWYDMDYAVPIGYSDHTKDIYASIGAVALGACVIEKHFILDYGMNTVDACVSVDPGDMRRLVEGCHAVHKCKGSRRAYYPKEREKLELFR